MRSRRRFGVAGVGILLGMSIGYVGQPDAESDPDDALAAFDDGAREPVTETPDPPPEDVGPQPEERDPSAPYPADPDALAFEELKPGEQETYERAQEWAELSAGEPVHNAFSAAVATTSTMRLVGQAQVAAGLTGIEDLGVVGDP